MVYNILSTKAVASTFISLLDVNTYGTGYMRLAGTSMAAPHVSGAAAAIISKNNSLNPSQIRAVLLNSADDVETPGRDDNSGMGRLNVYRAVTEMNTTPVTHGEIMVPQNLQIVRKLRDIIGTVEQPINSSFTLEYSKSSQGSWQTSGITLTGSGNGNILSGVLGKWDTSGLGDGRYYLKLSVRQNDPAQITTSMIQVIVGNSLPQGWPATISGQGYQFGPLINGEITGDGRDETLTQFGNELFAFNADGQSLPNWPLALNDYLSSSYFKPAIGEVVNSNPGKEIVVASTGSGLGDSSVLPKGLYVLDSSGKVLPNWPKSEADGKPLNISQYIPVISDIDQDGKNDIIYPTFNNNATDLLTVFKNDGTPLPGFPVQLPGFIVSSTNPVLVAKVDGQTRLILFVYDASTPSS